MPESVLGHSTSNGCTNFVARSKLMAFLNPRDVSGPNCTFGIRSRLSPLQYNCMTNILHPNLVSDGTHIVSQSFPVPKLRPKILRHNLTQLLGLLERNSMRTVQLPDHQIRQQPCLNRPMD
jgi:hypothetical protein